MRCSSNIAENAKIDEHSLAFTCPQYNNIGAETNKPGKAENQEHLSKCTRGESGKASWKR